MSNTALDRFLFANRAYLESADFDYIGAVDSLVDVIGYKGARRARFIKRLKALKPEQLAAVVWRYWKRDLVPLPAGFVAESSDVTEARAESGAPLPADDLRNHARRIMARFDECGRMVTREVTTPALDTFHAQQVKCAVARGCVGCKRLNSKTGFCRKWNRYINANLTAEAAAF